MLLSLTLLIVLGLTAFDKGEIGEALRRRLVHGPARRLARLSRGQALGLAFVLLLGGLAVALFEAEGLRLFSMAAPELAGWVMLFDVTVVFDMMVLAISLRAVAGWRGLARRTDLALGLASRLVSRAAGGARSRARRVRRPRPGPGADDVEPDAVFA